METPFDFENHATVVAVVGSREWPQSKRNWVEKFIDKLHPQTIVVSGGAKGVDTFAQTAVNQRKIKQRDIHFKPFIVEEFEWKLIGKRAGRVRNELLVKYLALNNGHAAVFALQDAQGNLTDGSKNVVMNCIKYNVPYTVYRQLKEGT